MEGLDGEEARERSFELARRLDYCHGFTDTREKFDIVGHVTRYWLTTCPLVIAMLIAINLNNHVLVRELGTVWLVIAIASLVLSLGLAVLLSSVNGITYALSYLKARRLGGEVVGELDNSGE